MTLEYDVPVEVAQRLVNAGVSDTVLFEVDAALQTRILSKVTSVLQSFARKNVWVSAALHKWMDACQRFASFAA